MNKAILVIDMPKSCNKCPLMYANDVSDWCSPMANFNGNVNKHTRNNTKPNWCPLNPVPYEQCEGGTWTMGGYIADEFSNGWNACLEEILD